MPLIKIDNLSVSYPPKKHPTKVLDGLSMEFKNGKVNVILGSSGSGKTTLVKSIIGLLDIDNGSIYFDDVEMNYISIKNRNIGYVDQNIRLYPHLSVFNNIAYPLTNTPASGEEIKQRVVEAADMMGIKHLLMRKPRQISLGQAQRVAIAKAIVKKPVLYIFDEPFSNLDEQLTLSLMVDLKQIFNKLEATVLFITHKKEEALLLGDYLYVMDNGNIVDQGNKEDILSSSNPFTKSLLGDSNV